MAVQVLNSSDAPREVFAVNPFRNDDRCEVFQVVIADTYAECVVETLSLHQANIAEGAPDADTHIFDWDHAYDNVTNKYIGFTCKDKEPFSV